MEKEMKIISNILTIPKIPYICILMFKIELIFYTDSLSSSSGLWSQILNFVSVYQSLNVSNNRFLSIILRLGLFYIKKEVYFVPSVAVIIDVFRYCYFFKYLISFTNIHLEPLEMSFVASEVSCLFLIQYRIIN